MLKIGKIGVKLQIIPPPMLNKDRHHWFQQFVKMLLLQNMPWLVRYKKIIAISFLPSVECGKFKLKKAFQNGKILACTKKAKSAPLLHSS